MLDSQARWPGLGVELWVAPWDLVFQHTGPPEFHPSPQGTVKTKPLSWASVWGPRLQTGQETPAGAFVFPSTTRLRKLLAGSQGCQRAASAKEVALSDGGSARARVPCMPQHRPQEERPGGGWGAEFDTPVSRSSLPALCPTEQRSSLQ